MKTKFLLLTMMVISSLMVNAQTIMNIHQSNGTVLQIPLNTIDSITYTIPNPGNLATLTTLAIGNITDISATTGGYITNDGSLPVTLRGVVWSTSPNPTTGDNYTTNGSGSGSYTSNLTGLTANTTYYVRAYCTFSVGTAYGNELSFTTTTGNLATITTLPVDSITDISATTGGNITNDGGSPITQRGVVWGTSPSPTTSNNSITNGSGTGSYTSNLTGLTANTTYYVRAYATNSAGTAYGNELGFTTTAGGDGGGIVTDPGSGVTFDGYTYSSIVLGNGQEWMAENLRTTTYSNGDTIPNVLDNIQWYNTTTGAWAHNNNDSLNENLYGKLYNWYTVADPRNVCPTGWHVPSDEEWNSLIGYLDTSFNSTSFGTQSTFAGGKMKSTGTLYWNIPNSNATNESGFSGLPGGLRDGSGAFSIIGYWGYWWSSTEHSVGNAWHRYVRYDDGDVYRNASNFEDGFSIRCLKD